MTCRATDELPLAPWLSAEPHDSLLHNFFWKLQGNTVPSVGGHMAWVFDSVRRRQKKKKHSKINLISLSLFWDGGRDRGHPE